MSKLTRRELMKLALSASGSSLLASSGIGCGLFTRQNTPSPITERFPDGWSLTSPPVLSPLPLDPASTRGTPGARTFLVSQEERWHQFHPDLPESPIWGYNGIFPGPTFHARIGEETVVRFQNNLPQSQGFGVPRTVVHLHGGHQTSRDDGFPTDYVTRGDSRDMHYPNLPPGGDDRETPSTLWYHDHLIDFTAENVYKGLVGLYLMFDDLDNGDETNSSGLRLPSGEFDIPLVFTDKQFSPLDGRLIYNSFDHDGFLGDKVAVNGRIQPTLDVYRRKYRFRFVNGSNARFYQFFLRLEGETQSLPSPFVQIASDGGLLPHPLDRSSFLLTNGEREEVILDFSEFAEGDEVILENRIDQRDGRGPNRLIPPGKPAMELLKFRVGGNAPDGDPSQVPNQLRELPELPKNLDSFPQEELIFDRKSGAWVINKKFFDQDVPLITTPLGSGAVWRLNNDTGRWWHPIHIHLEFFRILTRNGKPPPAHEVCRKDTLILAPRDEVEIFVRFRDYPGKYVLHCHNLEHEDMYMMARYDVVG